MLNFLLALSVWLALGVYTSTGDTMQALAQLQSSIGWSLVLTLGVFFVIALASVTIEKVKV